MTDTVEIDADGMLVSTITKHLRDYDSEIFNDRIAGAADYQAAKTGGNLKAPAIYIVESAQRRIGDPQNGYEQPIEFDWETSFIVICIVPPPCRDDDFTQGWVPDIVKPVRDVIFDALVGWCPFGDYPIIPASAVVGAAGGGRDGGYVEIIFTFSFRETFPICLHEDVTPDAALESFRVMMTPTPNLIGNCESSNDTEIQETVCETDGCEKPSNGPFHYDK